MRSAPKPTSRGIIGRIACYTLRHYVEDQAFDARSCRSEQTETTMMETTKYVRYYAAGKTSYGILEGDLIRELYGDIFGGAEPTGKTLTLRDATLLAPCDPKNVAAVGRNYRSHIADRNIQPAPFPGLFWKPSASIIGTEENILLPESAQKVHDEGGVGGVSGKKTRSIAPADAGRYIFGITGGNDVSERGWEKND